MPKTAQKKSKNVGELHTRKKKYSKGAFPYTVYNNETKTLYVRKCITVEETVLDDQTGEEKIISRQKQIWRRCDPQTAARAETVLAEIESELNFTAYGYARPLAGFAEICDEFARVELIDPIYENGRKIAGRRSLASPRSIVKMLKAHFGARPIESITYGDLEKLKIERLRAPVTFKTRAGKTTNVRARSVRSVNYELSFLRQIFNFAYRRRWLARSPFRDGKGLISSSQETRRHVQLTRIEEKRALALCVGRLAHLKPVIICILDAGFRWGELAGARWSDIDHENDFIWVSGYKNKMRAGRRVYITERIKKTLKEWRRLQKNYDKDLNTDYIIGYKFVRKGWEKVRARIGRPDLHLHDLRHVFATRLYYEAKNELGLVSEALGHSSIKTTEIYVNAQTSDVKKAIQRLNELNRD